ncbi:MAG: HEAT repeat domain-containing protein [Deltaproteobacteria bacterium]|nr:HEAT repeat domain-containing protein [Deltaproteobacteria bacterium]MBW2069688.1 HEAT repeat domain-containing protein [Deltaproteobacteria bacterium]
MIRLLGNIILAVACLALVSCAGLPPWEQRAVGDKVWYRQDGSAAASRADLEQCRRLVSDSTEVSRCMEEMGYIQMPRKEAELLRVKNLQHRGLSPAAIAERLQMSERQVRRYTDEKYELPQHYDLGHQPLEILRGLGAAGVDSLMDALDDPDPLVRSQAAKALGEIGDPRAVEPLLAALNDQEPLIRRQAAEALGKIGDDRAVAPLLAVLQRKDEAAHVRASAAETLGLLRNPIAVEPLLTALRDQDWNIRSRAAQALGNIGDTRAVEPLMAALADREAVVRQHLSEALGKIGDPRSRSALEAMLEDEDRNVRTAARQALQLLEMPGIR